MKNETLEKYVCQADITVVEAMTKIDANGKGIVFVVDQDLCLIGSVTDGDIRRGLIKTGNLSELVSQVMNHTPKYLTQKDANKAMNYMSENYINSVPILDKDKHIVDIIFVAKNVVDSEENSDALKDVPVVIMAGGKGTRLYPYTKILPKPLIPIGEIPIIEHIIDRFCKYGCSDYHLVVNHKKNMIKAYFNENEKSYSVSYAEEDKPLGTGGGLSLLKGKIHSTFILTNCDILILEDYEKIYNLHKEKGNVITMVCSLKNFVIPYGVVEMGEDGNIAQMKEKPKLSFFTNTGYYIVEPEVIEELEADTAIGFPDIIERYKQQGKKVGVFPIGENAWLDMGQLDELERMREYLGVEE